MYDTLKYFAFAIHSPYLELACNNRDKLSFYDRIEKLVT